MKGGIQLSESLDLLKGQRLWEAITNHFDGVESQVILFQQIAENPLEYTKTLVQGLHGDLLLMAKNGEHIWPESILSASMAARILEVLTGEETPPKYQGQKWRHWNQNDEA
jgi:hypothetical protein